jgi:hypothetical protein
VCDWSVLQVATFQASLLIGNFFIGLFSEFAVNDGYRCT